MLLYPVNPAYTSGEQARARITSYELHCNCTGLVLKQTVIQKYRVIRNTKL